MSWLHYYRPVSHKHTFKNASEVRFKWGRGTQGKFTTGVKTFGPLNFSVFLHPQMVSPCVETASDTWPLLYENFIPPHVTVSVVPSPPAEKHPTGWCHPVGLMGTPWRSPDKMTAAVLSHDFWTPESAPFIIGLHYHQYNHGCYFRNCQKVVIVAVVFIFSIKYKRAKQNSWGMWVTASMYSLVDTV